MCCVGILGAEGFEIVRLERSKFGIVEPVRPEGQGRWLRPCPRTDRPLRDE
jgi:hypothetical protein